MKSPFTKSRPIGLKKLALTAAFAAVVIGSAAQPAHADWDHDHGRDGGHFYGHGDRDWHGGHWYHGNHEGRPGWWWQVGGHWYPYERPVYPYPANPYGAPEVYAPPVYAAPPPEPEPGINLIVPLHIR